MMAEWEKLIQGYWINSKSSHHKEWTISQICRFNSLKKKTFIKRGKKKKINVIFYSKVLMMISWKATIFSINGDWLHLKNCISKCRKQQTGSESASGTWGTNSAEMLHRNKASASVVMWNLTCVTQIVTQTDTKQIPNR